MADRLLVVLPPLDVVIDLSDLSEATVMTVDLLLRNRRKKQKIGRQQTKLLTIRLAGLRELVATHGPM